MKIFWIVLAIIVVALAVNALVNYLVQRRRQQRAEREGVVVYGTVVSLENVGGLMKYADLKKVTMRVQEPGTTTGREVVLRTRIPAGQALTPGMKVPVIIDPKNPKRIFPASPEAAKRVVITGSRLERRQMRVQQQNQPQRDPIPYPRHLNRR
jgi:hypothetical protein